MIFSHIINLLTNIPTICYEELLSPIVPDDENDNDEHEGKNMKAIYIILQFLDYQVTKNVSESKFSFFFFFINLI